MTRDGHDRDEATGAAALTEDGRFRAGDVATIAPEGWMRVADRTRDPIESDGEGIGSTARGATTTAGVRP